MLATTLLLAWQRPIKTVRESEVYIFRKTLLLSDFFSASLIDLPFHFDVQINAFFLSKTDFCKFDVFGSLWRHCHKISLWARCSQDLKRGCSAALLKGTRYMYNGKFPFVEGWLSQIQSHLGQHTSSSFCLTTKCGLLEWSFVCIWVKRKWEFRL